MTTIDKFNSLDWHDAIILQIVVDRSNPGECDSVSITIRWPNGKSNIISFNDCYMLDARMNFGVIAEECILGAECTSDNESIATVKDKWSSIGVQLDGLHRFSIETNSTNSILNIYSLSFNLD
jgi:hypothetical protein